MDAQERTMAIKFVVKLVMMIIIIIGVLIFGILNQSTGTERIITVALTIVFCLGLSLFTFVEVRNFIQGMQMRNAKADNDRKRIE